MTISIIDTHHVLVDGKDIGHIIDAIRSSPPRADPVEMKAAFDAWFIEYHDEKMRAVAEAVAAKDAVRRNSDAVIAALTDQHTAEKAALEADIATLGTKPEAEEIRKQLEITAVQRSVDAQMAKLTALRAETKP